VTTWICNKRWQAPRPEVPRSVPVEHVCDLKIDHEGRCHCSCGALG
jgi:hypothetical protein